MLLAGDLGGTKTLLGLFEPGAGRPTATLVREFVTLDCDGLPSMVERLLSEARVPASRVQAAAIGVAGPIVDQAAELTNVPWVVRADEVTSRTGIERLRLLNDVEAMAWSLDRLQPGDLAVVKPGKPAADGHAVLLTVGTGLGQSLLHRVDGRLLPQPGEGGHSDFAARTPREIEVLVELTREFGRVDVERIVSGPGLAHLARVTHGGPCPLVDSGDASHVPAAVSANAIAGRCPRCREALELMMGALGSFAGNLALVGVARAGVFIGGGIPPKIRPAFEWPMLVEAFVAKPPMRELLDAIPVSVILEEQAGLIGAAVFAEHLGGSH